MSTLAPTLRPTFPRLVRSESIKLTSLRSPWWSAALVVVLSVGISILMAQTFASMPAGDYSGQVDGLMGARMVLIPTTFTVLLATIIGAMQSSGEYSTGMILASTTASPRRVGSVVAKAVVVALFVFVTSLVSFLISAIVTTPILDRMDAAMDWSEPAYSWGPILLGSVAMAVFALIGLSAGYLLRSPAGSLAVAIGVVFVLPLIPGFFAIADAPAWVADVARMLPTNAFQALVLDGEKHRTVSAVALAAWAVIPLLGAVLVVKRRDA